MIKEKELVHLSFFNSAIKGLDMMLIFFLAIHFVNINLTGAQIGIIFALGSFTAIATILPSGFSSDRYNAKNLITFALFLVAIFYLGMAFTNNFYLIAALFIIGSIGKNLYNTASQSLFHKSSQNENLKEKISFFQSLNYLAIGAGIILAGYLLNINFTFANLFLINGMMFLAAAIAGQLVLPTNETAEFKMIHYKKDLLKPSILFFMLIIFLFALHIGAEMTSYGLFLKENLKLTPANQGLYMGISILFMALSVTLLGKKLEHIKPKNVLITGLLTSGLGLILMTFGSPQFSLAFRIIHEIGDSAVFFFLYYGISKMFDLSRVGGNNGIFLLIISVGATISSFICAPLGEFYGYNISLIVGGATTLLAFILTLFFSNLIHHE